ncbi:carbohydrate deacetylase [Methylocystis heyeri]|nr:ChbG/HpnK family deacetylase [Methylocystis heyeri]
MNADDFGISKKANLETAELMEAKAVTSATIIANGPEFDQAIAFAKKLPECSFGVHLNITQFAPLSKNPELEPLLDGNGEFSSAQLPQTPGLPLQRAIIEELQLQINRVRSALGRISHVDSHHHIHTRPMLFPLLVYLIQANRIKAARLTKNLYAPANAPNTSQRLKKQIWNTALRAIGKCHTTDYFTDLSALRSNLKRLDGAVIEIMCHPGHPDFEDETQLIRSDWRAGLDAEVDLITYDALTRT